MTFASDLLECMDECRSFGGDLGLRPYVVTRRRRVWSGSRPGIAGTTHVDTNIVLTNQGPNGVLYPVLVKQVSRSEALSSGGQYSSRDLKVGPMTPAYAASFNSPSGGFDDTTMNPAPTGQAVELIWIIAAPNGTFGIPAGGVIAELRGEEATALHTYLVLRSTGRAVT